MATAKTKIKTSHDLSSTPIGFQFFSNKCDTPEDKNHCRVELNKTLVDTERKFNLIHV